MDKHSFRKNTPTRRIDPVVKSKYGDYFDLLREDFLKRCGYCDSFDLRRDNDFEIDHFVPRRVFSKVKENDYNNLVYSCKSCNRSKSGKWPSNDENISVVGNVGFIDPCDNKYDNQFYRDKDGEIQYETEHGRWMYLELSLYNPKHSILWYLEKIMKDIKEAKMLADIKPDDIKVIKGLNALLLIQDKYLNKLFNIEE